MHRKTTFKPETKRWEASTYVLRERSSDGKLVPMLTPSVVPLGTVLRSEGQVSSMKSAVTYDHRSVFLILSIRIFCVPNGGATRRRPPRLWILGILKLSRATTGHGSATKDAVVVPELRISAWCGFPFRNTPVEISLIKQWTRMSYARIFPHMIRCRCLYTLQPGRKLSLITPLKRVILWCAPL